MSYVDTSVLVAALDPEDPRLDSAKGFLEQGGYKLVSELTLVELASVIGRRSDFLADLSKRLGVDERKAALAVLTYIIKRFNLVYKEVDSSKLVGFHRMYSPMAEAVNFSNLLRLKTLDLLHAAYMKTLKDMGEPVSEIVTVDADFKKAENLLKTHLDVSVRLL